MSMRRWRFYTTSAGRQPIREFLDSLVDEDRAAALEGASLWGPDAFRWTWGTPS